MKDFLINYHPDYKEKGLSEPTFALDARVLVKSRCFGEDEEISQTGRIVDIEVAEDKLKPDDGPQWQYFVDFDEDKGYGAFFDSELTLIDSDRGFEKSPSNSKSGKLSHSQMKNILSVFP